MMSQWKASINLRGIARVAVPPLPRHIFLLFTLMATLLFWAALLSARAEADWNPSGESTTVIYEVLPFNGRVHVTLLYHLKNLDEQTGATGTYYDSWHVTVPAAAINIEAYDVSQPLSFTAETDAPWNYLELQLNQRLFYGGEYDFAIEYDLTAVTQNVAFFTAYGKGNGASSIKIMLPKGYYDEVHIPEDYTVTETDAHAFYRYQVDEEGYRYSASIGVSRRTELESLSGRVELNDRTVQVTVKYWSGEAQKAAHILDLYQKSLPLLEQLTAVPFPAPYDIEVMEATYDGTRGYAGENRGEDGIFIRYDQMQEDSTLVHELAHYWATSPPFAETWMQEGYADLYAYVVLGQLKELTEAEELVKGRAETYQSGKEQFDLPLSQWEHSGADSPEEGFGYGKSFVFVFDLYQRLGQLTLLEDNRRALAWDNPVDWVDYLEILETSGGQELGQLFVGWVVPESFGASFDTWQEAERNYRATKATLQAVGDRLGIDAVESALTGVRSLIMNGDFAEALTQSQSALDLVPQWQSALRAFQDAEAAVDKAKYEGRTWRLRDIELKLWSTIGLMVNGEMSQSVLRAQAVKEAADRAFSPQRAIAPYLTIGLAGLAFLYGGILIVRRTTHRTPPAR